MCRNASRRRTVVHAARDRKARPDVATGGDPTAMTTRVVSEAVEPRARTYIYAHKNQGLHKRDKLREQSRHGVEGAMLWQLLRAARGPTMFGRAVGTTGVHGTLCVVVFFLVNATCPHSGTSRRPPREGILPSWKRSVDVVQRATARAVPTAGSAGVIDSRHREPHRRSQSVSKSRPLSPWPPRPTW